MSVLKIWYVCWLPYPQNPITGNTPYGTGNATCTSTVIFVGDITPGTSAAKAGLPYQQTYITDIAAKMQRTIPVMCFF
jgi:hypothetical protein